MRSHFPAHTAGFCERTRRCVILGLMSVLEIREMGDPVLRERAAEVSVEELASAETQAARSERWRQSDGNT